MNIDKFMGGKSDPYREVGMDQPQYNPRAVAGDNAPDTLSLARITFADLNTFAINNPVIQTHEQAKAAAKLEEIARGSLSELKRERLGKTKPLKDEAKEIEATYAKASDPLEAILATVKGRKDAFLRAEEAKRAAEADRVRREAEAAQEASREAQRRLAEQEANAQAGEIGLDMGFAILEARAVQEAALRLSRQAKIAERDTTVRIATGSGRAQGLRTEIVLHLDNAISAILAMGTTDKIRDAILSEARAYHATNKVWPKGVRAETVR